MLPSFTAALTAGLLPVVAFSAPKEILRIQIGKEKDVLDTVTLVIEYDKLP